ncbi:MAG: HPr kinase/phosphorylase [Gammaproteobacteria bacterium]|nr:MAG: HPr kinase/phosphorylase [Gammaproteobacteria bacterium]
MDTHGRLTVGKLLEPLIERFGFTWVAGRDAAERPIEEDFSWGSHPKVVGHLNVIHHNRIQVLGRIEREYLDGLPAAERAALLQRLFDSVSFAVIVCEDQPIADDLKRLADRHRVALLAGGGRSNELVTELRYVLTHMLAEKTTLHGVFMEVTSLGVLITGDASIGKSELALELITRGHRLVCDDAPEFARITPDIVSGHAPPMLQDLLEVRGLGVLNIREMYGDGAIKKSKYLRLIIDLVPTEKYGGEIDRLHGDAKRREVLGVPIAQITLPVAPGRNLAVMVEAAVLKYLLWARGRDAGRELVERQRRALDSGHPFDAV